MTKGERAHLRARVVAAVDEAKQCTDLRKCEAKFPRAADERKATDRFGSIDAVASGRAAGWR